MSMIEGVGDEVATFFIVMNIILIVIVAWITTDTRRQSNIHTVYLLRRRRVRRSRSQRLTNHTESATISEGTDPIEGTSSVEEVPLSPNSSEEASERNKPPEPEGRRSRSESGDESEQDDQEQSEIVQAMDGDLDGLRRRRLAFFESERSPLDDLLDGDTYTESANISDNIIAPEMQTEEEAASSFRTAETSIPTSSNESQPNGSNITIKLKYINDDLKIVDGRLSELLGDFKRRHFEMELSSNKLVRLIFNGQVLQRDSETLQSYGMFDNCVVHCLVHQQRNVPGENGRNEGGEGVNNNLNNNNNSTQRDWDLGNLLIATTSFSLGSAWYFRYQYPQLFTVTATVGLVAVTGIFTVISIGTYFIDLERQPQRTVNFSLR